MNASKEANVTQVRVERMLCCHHVFGAFILILIFISSVRVSSACCSNVAGRLQSSTLRSKRTSTSKGVIAVTPPFLGRPSRIVQPSVSMSRTAWGGLFKRRSPRAGSSKFDAMLSWNFSLGCLAHVGFTWHVNVTT